MSKKKDPTRGMIQGIVNGFALCSGCQKDPAILPEHPCPYKEDVGGDSETLCDCCTACMGECSSDI